MRTKPIDDEIVRVVGQLQRTYERVYPYQVGLWLDCVAYRAEQTLRRDMCRLARQGRLIRVGGRGCRQGYITASQVDLSERFENIRKMALKRSLF